MQMGTQVIQVSNVQSFDVVGEFTSSFTPCSLYRDGLEYTTIKGQLLDGALQVVGWGDYGVAK